MAIIPRSPPLRLKVLVILGGGMLLLLGGTIIGLFFLMRHDFNRLARELAEQRVERVVNSFATRAEALHASVADNAVWDETYDFVRGMSGREYLSRNYYNSASIDESYDFVLVFGARNEFLGGVTHHGNGFQETPPPASIRRNSVAPA